MKKKTYDLVRIRSRDKKIIEELSKDKSWPERHGELASFLQVSTGFNKLILGDNYRPKKKKKRKR